MTTEVINIVVREDGSRVVKRNIEEMGGAAEKAGQGLLSLKNAAIAAFSGVVLTQIRQMADQYITMQNRLRLVTGDQANLNAVFKEIVDISGRTRSSLEGNVELYSRLAISAKDLGVSQKDLLEFTESLNKAIKISGATAQESEAGLRQLSQGLASGALRGDELISVLENLPAVADVIAKSMGVTRGQLRALGAEGKVTAGIIIDAFKKAKTEIDENFGKTASTAAEGFVGLKNQLLVTIGAIEEATGASTIFGGALQGITDFIKEITPQIVNFMRAIMGTLDPTDELSISTKLLASTFVVLYGSLKAIGQLLLGTVVIAFKTVGRVIGGIVAAVMAALHGEFGQAFEIVKEAASDIKTVWVDEGKDMAQDIVGTTTDMFDRLNNIWDKGTRDIQDRSKNVMGDINDKAGPAKVIGPSEAELKKQAAAMEKVRRELEGLLNQIAPIAGATLEYAHAQVVLNAAEQKGLINATQKQEYLVLLKKHYDEILDPLGKFNKELDRQARLLQMTSQQAEIENQVFSATEQMKERGVILTEREVAALREKFTALQELNRVAAAEDQLMQGSVQKRQQYVDQLTAINKLLKDSSSGFTKTDATDALMQMNPDLFEGSQEAMDAQRARTQEMYSQIDMMRQQDLISEQTASAAKVRIWMESQEKQLQSATTFLGYISQLQKSQNAKAARIGKAAAIAQATIDTYKAATGAYASLASIPYVGPVLGAAAAAAAIIAGMQNIQAIRNTNSAGYMVGGYTGKGAINEFAGDVHKGEYVHSMSSVSRHGLSNLESLDRGTSSIVPNKQMQGGRGGWGVNVSIANYGTSKQFDVQQLSAEEVRIIARDESSRQVQKITPDLVAGQLGSPNSRVSRSLSTNTHTERRR